jgi:outer membrane immunogenic protein
MGLIIRLRVQKILPRAYNGAHKINKTLEELMKLKNVVLIAAAVTAAASSTQATAADLPARAYTAPAAVAAPVHSWTGFYVGAGFGYGLFDVESSGRTVSNGDTGGRGYLGTVQLGYDAQLANWVVGIFGDYDWSNIKGTLSDLSTGNNFTLKQTSAWSVGGRIGYLVVPQFLTYFSGGYTEAKFNGGTGICATGACAAIGTLPHHSFSGYFLGGGTEYAFSWFGPGWTIKSEYRLAEYSRETFAVATAPALAGGTTATMRPFVQTIRSELVYKFNWGQ